MADHYRLLGVAKNATKEEIKEAFRKLAIQFHPDKHAQSSKSARDAATVKFKQVSEAYEILSDNHKRAAYNLSRRSGTFSSGGNGSAYGYGYSRANYDANYYGAGGRGSYYRHSYRTNGSSNSNQWASSLEFVLRYMTTREFLRNLVFAGLLLAGSVAVDMSGDTLWKMQNTGKTFEDTMESIQKKKPHKDRE